MTRLQSVVASILCAFPFLQGTAGADTIFFKNRQKMPMNGTIVREDEKTVVIRGEAGIEMTVDRFKIDRIEYEKKEGGSSFEQQSADVTEYYQRRAAIPEAGSAEELKDLEKWCRDRGLTREATLTAMERRRRTCNPDSKEDAIEFAQLAQAAGLENEALKALDEAIAHVLGSPSPRMDDALALVEWARAARLDTSKMAHRIYESWRHGLPAGDSTVALGLAQWCTKYGAVEDAGRELGSMLVSQPEDREVLGAVGTLYDRYYSGGTYYWNGDHILDAKSWETQVHASGVDLEDVYGQLMKSPSAYEGLPIHVKIRVFNVREERGQFFAQGWVLDSGGNEQLSKPVFLLYECRTTLLQNQMVDVSGFYGGELQYTTRSGMTCACPEILLPFVTRDALPRYLRSMSARLSK